MVRFSIFSSAIGLLSIAAAAPVDSRYPTIRVMPFGASIVEITCWRAYLWKKLQEQGITNIDFVGSHGTPSAGCKLNGAAVNFDKDNEGHSGAKATEYVNKNQLPAWLSAAKPDIILMHLGTNDATAKIPKATLFTAYDRLLSQMRAQNPRVTLIASKLIDIDPKMFGQAVTDLVKEYNTELDAWVKRSTTSQSAVVLADPYTGFDYKTMTREGEHPNEKGDVFMADKYFPVVKNEVSKSTVRKWYNQKTGKWL